MQRVERADQLCVDVRNLETHSQFIKYAVASTNIKAESLEIAYTAQSYFLRCISIDDTRTTQTTPNITLEERSCACACVYLAFLQFSLWVEAEFICKLDNVFYRRISFKHAMTVKLIIDEHLRVLCRELNFEFEADVPFDFIEREFQKELGNTVSPDLMARVLDLAYECCLSVDYMLLAKNDRTSARTGHKKFPAVGKITPATRRLLKAQHQHCDKLTDARMKTLHFNGTGTMVRTIRESVGRVLDLDIQ